MPTATKQPANRPDVPAPDWRRENIVKFYRNARGWTQGELAERVGVNTQVICYVERGRNLPTAANLVAIGKSLGLRPDDLRGALILFRDYVAANPNERPAPWGKRPKGKNR